MDYEQLLKEAREEFRQEYSKVFVSIGYAIGCESFLDQKLRSAYRAGELAMLECAKEETLKEVEAEMLDKIYYIGNELPQVKEDVRDKFVLLGYPQKFLDDLRNRLTALHALREEDKGMV